jgi:hypothetical protein
VVRSPKRWFSVSVQVDRFRGKRKDLAEDPRELLLDRAEGLGLLDRAGRFHGNRLAH